MKTFDKKDVYSWSNCEEAKTYIGKTGYFNNDFLIWFILIQYGVLKH